MSRRRKYGTRVIHTRISDNVLLGCYDMLKISNVAVSGMPMATAVATVLDAAIASLRKDGTIPSYSTEPGLDPTSVLNEMHGIAIPKMPRVEVGGMMGDLVRNAVQERQQPAQLGLPGPDGTIRDEIKKRLALLAEPDLTIGKGDLTNKEYEEEEEYKVKPTLDISGLVRLDFADIRDEAPTNKLVMLSNEETTNKSLRLAIEMAFSFIDAEEWKTKRTTKIVSDLITHLDSFDLSGYAMWEDRFDGPLPEIDENNA